MQRFLNYAVGVLIVATLTLAGPVSLGLALYTDGPLKRAEISAVKPPQLEPVIGISPEPLLWPVQDPVPGVTVPEATEAVPVTPSQEVVVEWGNWVEILLKPIQDAALALIPLVALWIMSKLPGVVRLVLPANRINDLLEKAVISALASVRGATQGKTLSVQVTNDVIRQVIIYALAQAPHLVGSLGDNLPALIQKALARLPEHAKVPVGFTIEEAVKKVTKESVLKKAKEQGVADKIKGYFDTY